MKAPFDITANGWKKFDQIKNQMFICGYCSNQVASDRGYGLYQQRASSANQVGGIYICPNCNGPTFFTPDGQKFPGTTMGNVVAHLPEDVESLYEESRKCSSQKAYTATVMLCRKILMSLAVGCGAKENLNFLGYVTYLSDQGYVPPNGKHWVDHIRKKGNEANHEIQLMQEKDARDLLLFTEMLLRFIYEFPNIVPKAQSQEEN